MGIINTQAVANAKKVLTGKNGALYNAKQIYNNERKTKRNYSNN